MQTMQTELASEPVARATDSKTPMPEDWVPLAKIAAEAGTRANVLRKHRVAGWQREGLAGKDAAGNWWASPAVLDTFEPGPGPGPAPAVERALAALAGEGGRPPTPRESEAHVAAAMRCLLAVRPIPWPLVMKLCSMGKRYAGQAAGRPEQTEESCTCS
jgi:hypothetical protein